jgi:hypothetical protein
MQPDKEIVIPLGYKGKVVITKPPTEYKVYATVAELMHDFPRFVRVEKAFFVQSKDNTAIQIKAGTTFISERNNNFFIWLHISSPIFYNSLTP